MDVKNITILVVIASIISAGGIGGIVVAVIKFSSSIIADRLSKKYESKLETALEKQKAELSKKEYVSKTRFDTEFSIYRELTSVFFAMVKAVSILIPYGLATVPADDKARKELEDNNYSEANNAIVKAQDALYANASFIPKEYCDLYQELLKLAGMQTFAFGRRYNVLWSSTTKAHLESEDYLRTKEIIEKWDSLTDKIRDYLSEMDVIS